MVLPNGKIGFSEAEEQRMRDPNVFSLGPSVGKFYKPFTNSEVRSMEKQIQSTESMDDHALELLQCSISARENAFEIDKSDG